MTTLTRCFHGTTADNLASILSHGLLACPSNRVWNCSENAVYGWTPEALVEAGECEEEYSHDRAFQMAVENAQCALGKAKDCRAVVIEFEVPSDELESDQSCENMDMARCFFGDIPLSSIRKISISSDLSLLRGYFLSLMADRNYSNIELSDTESRIAKCMAEAFYPEDVDDMTEWEVRSFEESPLVHQ